MHVEGIQSVYARIDAIERKMHSLDADAYYNEKKKTFADYLKAKLGEDFGLGAEALQAKQSVTALSSVESVSDSSVNGVDVSESARGMKTYALREAADEVKTAYDDIIAAASKKYGIPETMIKAVIKQESNYNPNAVSAKGAQGLMQLMPQTAAELGIDPKNAFDPETNIFGGTNYLNQMLTRYDNNWINALAAYNAGPNAVDRYSGVPDFSETQDYVKRVLNLYGTYNGLK